jgi:hypothetical protein
MQSNVHFMSSLMQQQTAKERCRDVSFLLLRFFVGGRVKVFATAHVTSLSICIADFARFCLYQRCVRSPLLKPTSIADLYSITDGCLLSGQKNTNLR